MRVGREPKLQNGRDLLRDAVQTLAGKDVDVLNIMHTNVTLVDECLEVVRSAWDGIVGVYAHSHGDRSG